MQTTRHHNNLTLFVTVLSACLGLLAAGLPAQVSAQQAVRLAQPSASGERCDIKLAVVEDLFNTDAYLLSASDFIADLRRLVAIEKYSYGDYGHVDVTLTLPGTPGPLNFQSFSESGWLRMIAEEAAEKAIFAFEREHTFYRHEPELNLDAARFEVAYHLNQSGLGITTTQEQETETAAQKLAATYTANFKLAACRARDGFERSFYENTVALAREHKIVIITNLPRAALEDSPAEEPAAN